jgi:hypothetical protein
MGLNKGGTMPTYPVKHKQTGETKELYMSIAEYDQWRKDNADWDKNWSAGCASAISEVGDWRNKVPSPVKEKLQTIKQNHYGSTIDV